MLAASAKVVVTGFGYTGERLCRRLCESGVDVVCLSRQHENHARIRSVGATPISWDLDATAGVPTSWATDRVLVHLVPPPSGGAIDTRLRSLLDGIADSLPAALILISTSGVYGDRRGEWVYETDVINPSTDRAIRRADAEHIAREFCVRHGVRLVIVRVAGIYGPGRLPLKRLRDGTALPPSESLGLTNRIHVDDLVTVIAAAADRGEDGGVYNVADGVPLTMRDWYERVAEVAGLAPPPLITMADASRSLSPTFLSFLTESRRLNVDRLVDSLAVELAYRDPNTGIKSALDKTPS